MAMRVHAPFHLSLTEQEVCLKRVTVPLRMRTRRCCRPHMTDHDDYSCGGAGLLCIR